MHQLKNALNKIQPITGIRLYMFQHWGAIFSECDNIEILARNDNLGITLLVLECLQC